MKKKIIIVALLIITIISSITFVVLSNKNGKSINNNGNQIAMYLLDGENGSVLSEVNTIESKYLLDETKTVCTGVSGVTGTVTLANQKLSLQTNGSVKCNVYFYEEKKPIVCVDASNNEITCPNSWTQGDRIAIGEGTNKQYFRYLRTTSTSTKLAECGSSSSVACADATDGDLRFLAEYNLKRTGTAAASAVASDALQDPSDSANTNSVIYGASSPGYNQSYVKTYMANYQSVLNTMIGETDAIKVNLMTYPEIKSLGWGCPASGTGTCSSIPAWAKNSNYWLGSASGKYSVWRVNPSSALNGFGCDGASLFGARAVVTIDPSLLQ